MKKRLRYIDKEVLEKVVADYGARLPNGNFQYRLEDLAKKYEISLSTVNNIARAANCQGRPRGKKLEMPDARTLKLLRDATEPYISYAAVGRRNARWVTVYPRYYIRHDEKRNLYWSSKGWGPQKKARKYSSGVIKKISLPAHGKWVKADNIPPEGKLEMKPLSKQRVKQIIDFWQSRGNPGVRSRGFKPGQKLVWNGRTFTVLRYDNCRQGAVVDDTDNAVIDPFLWYYQGMRAEIVDYTPHFKNESDES